MALSETKFGDLPVKGLLKPAHAARLDARLPRLSGNALVKAQKLSEAKPTTRQPARFAS